jgi:hypothetical protein
MPPKRNRRLWPNQKAVEQKYAMYLHNTSLDFHCNTLLSFVELGWTTRQLDESLHSQLAAIASAWKGLCCSAFAAFFSAGYSLSLHKQLCTCLNKSWMAQSRVERAFKACIAVYVWINNAERRLEWRRCVKRALLLCFCCFFQCWILFVLA